MNPLLHAKLEKVPLCEHVKPRREGFDDRKRLNSHDSRSRRTRAKALTKGLDRFGRTTYSDFHGAIRQVAHRSG